MSELLRKWKLEKMTKSVNLSNGGLKSFLSPRNGDDS